jgi:hypothetical protein
MPTKSFDFTELVSQRTMQNIHVPSLTRFVFIKMVE